MILGKISKSDDIRCQILRLKCTKFDFRWGYAPDPAGGAYSTLPDPLAVFKGPSSKGRDFRKGRIAVRKGTEKSKGREWKGSEGEKREGEGKGFTGLMSNCFPWAVKRVSGTTQVSRYQKGKTNLDFTEARDSEWQWCQLGHMHVCTSLQTDNHASIPPLRFYRPDALPAAQPTASKH